MTISESARRSARGFTPALIEHARHRYEETDETQASIALDLNVHRKTLAKLARSQGWVLRKDRMMRDIPASLQLHAEAAGEVTSAAVEAEEAPAIPKDIRDDAPVSPTIAARLEQAVEAELRKVEALRSEFGPISQRGLTGERTARTLATLSETLFKVRKLRETGPVNWSGDDDLPADTDGFRHALALRIENFVRSRTDGRIPAGPDDPDATTA